MVLRCPECAAVIAVNPTTRQEKLAVALNGGQHGSIGAAMRAAGYADSYADTRAGRVARSTQVQARLEELKSAQRRGKSNAVSIETQALRKIGVSLNAVKPDGTVQSMQSAAIALKSASDYRAAHGDEEAQAPMDETRALALRFLIGGLLLGARLGGMALATAERYAARLAGTRYELPAWRLLALRPPRLALPPHVGTPTKVASKAKATR